MPNMQRTALALTTLNLGVLAGMLGFNHLAAAPAAEPVLRAELIERVSLKNQSGVEKVIAP